jgi:hypothetical protein
MEPLWAAGRGMRALHTLNAVGNGLSTLPASIGDFRALRYVPPPPPPPPLHRALAPGP